MLSRHWFSRGSRSPQLHAPAVPGIERKWKDVVIICMTLLLIAISLQRARKNQMMLDMYQQQIDDAIMPPRVSPKIWQIYFNVVRGNSELYNTQSWIEMNPDSEYTLVGFEDGDKFVEENYAYEPSILHGYRELTNHGLKSDLLRYLILGAEGGVYSDIDTIPLKPIDEWVPDYLKNYTRVVIGLEWDRGNGGTWADIYHDVQFCQWTMAAAPGHPIFMDMTNRALDKLWAIAEETDTPLSALEPTNRNVLNSTGPAAWTEVVFRKLQEADPSLAELKDLSGMREPRLYGDILILPIDAFGMGQPHSHSTNDGTIPADALVKHNFDGSWKVE